MSKEQMYADRMERTAFKVMKIIGMVILGLLAASMLGFVVKWLWNWLMTDIFGLAEITYWQGVGLFILGRILLGGFGSTSSSSSSSESPKGVIKQAIHEEMQENFKKEFREKYQEHVEDVVDDSDNHRQDNAQTEAAYDAWWDEEGEKLFAEFLEKDQK